MTTFKITSVGTGKNGWYHITHPVIGYCGMERGYKKVLQRIEQLEAEQPAPRPTFDAHNFYAQQITSTKRNK